MAGKYLAAVLAIILFFSLSGCDGGIYSAEKRFWRALLKYNRLTQNVKEATHQDYHELINAFREITIRYPQWDNSAKAQLYIAQLYAVQNNLSKSRDEFGVILREYPDNQDICATALFNIAALYDKENDWEKARGFLDRVEKEYPDSGSAFQVPLYIAEHYKKKSEVFEMDAAYSAALDKYQQIIRKNPKTYGALMAVDFAVSCYGGRDKWEEAITYLSTLSNDYPDTLLAPKALFATGAIYQEKLGQSQRALGYYRQITEKYPNTNFAKSALQLMEKVNKVK